MENQKEEPSIFYYRNLPHYDPPGATLFITFRLADSIPKIVINQLKQEYRLIKEELDNMLDRHKQNERIYLEQRKYFGRWDKAIDKMDHGPMWLSDPLVANLIQESIEHRHNKVYYLYAYCILSNHVHILFAPLLKSGGSYHRMADIMQSLKGYTAYNANQLLGRSGKFWQAESYDHVVRDPDEHQRIVNYILNNPVKAGLAKQVNEWPWSYSS